MYTIYIYNQQQNSKELCEERYIMDMREKRKKVEDLRDGVGDGVILAFYL